MSNNLEHKDIREYLSNLVGIDELIRWQRDFCNQDLHYAGFVCKVESQYGDDCDAPYSGCIYLNGESMDIFVVGESPYSYAKDFWKTVDRYTYENSTVKVVRYTSKRCSS